MRGGSVNHVHVLRDSQELVGLQTQSPLGMIKAVAQSECAIRCLLGAIHRLQEEVLERERLEGSRVGARLGKDQFQLVAARLYQGGAGFGAYTEPVHSRRRRDRSIGFDGDLKAPAVERVDERRVQLQKRFAAGADNESPARSRVRRPFRFDRNRQILSGIESSTPRPIDSYKFGIAEPADGRGAVGLATRPEIASGKAAEDGGAARLRALALQGIEDLFDRVTHKSCF